MRRRAKQWTRAAIFGALAVAALAGAEAASATAAGAQLELKRCRKVHPDARCGAVGVPFERGNPASRQLRLRFAVLRHTNRKKKPRTPVFVILGGPGFAPSSEPDNPLFFFEGRAGATASSSWTTAARGDRRPSTAVRIVPKGRPDRPQSHRAGRRAARRPFVGVFHPESSVVTIDLAGARFTRDVAIDGRGRLDFAQGGVLGARVAVDGPAGADGRLRLRGNWLSPTPE
jgi:hypothetical protein